MLFLFAPKIVEQAEKDLGGNGDDMAKQQGAGGQQGKFKVNANVKGTVNAPDAASALKSAGGGGGQPGAGRQAAGANRKAGKRAAG